MAPLKALNARLWVKRVVVCAVVLLVVAQLVPANHHNPGTDPQRSIFAKEQVPAPVQTVFRRSCANCHSNETEWPWYSYIAPASWIIADDVHSARKKMNLSEWADYPANKREEKLEEICEQLTDGDMPDAKYLLVHRNARLTSQEREAVCQWTEDSRQY